MIKPLNYLRIAAILRSGLTARRLRPGVPSLVLVAICCAAMLADSQFRGWLLRIVSADTSPQTLPFSQNWTNIGLITTDGNWSAVPGVIGYRGDDLTAATGTNPQTIVADGSSTPVNVEANETNPNSFATGGVAEFHIADPTIALNGSGTADAPHIVFTLNTTGQTSLNVAYNLRDLDGSIDNAVMPVALQFRVGMAGNYTDVPAGFVADATTGPSLATLVTPVSATLPAAADNQAVVQVRVITCNAVGNDEWVGIDDINITAGGGGKPALSLSILPASFSEAAGANAATGMVQRANDPNLASALTVTLINPDTSEISIPSSVMIPANMTSTTFMVDAVDDMIIDGTQTVIVEAAVSGFTSGTATVMVSDNDVVMAAIHDIQGSGAVSPFAGQSVNTTGIVTARKSNGFFLQEPDASVDANPATSEGVFVFTAGVPTVAVGDAVSVTGSVTEFFGLTEISSSPGDILVTSSGNTLPAPIVLTTTILDPAGALDQLERFEGMRMHADSLISVAPTNDFGETFTVLSGVVRPLREPGIEISLPVPPDPTSGVPDCCIPRWDENPERIMIDSEGLIGSSVISVTSHVTFSNITGPLDFTFDDYKVLPETPPTTSANISAVPVPAPAAGEFTVAGFNIENFNNNATQRQKAALAIRDVLLLPDIIGTIEIFDLADLQALATQIQTISGVTYEARLIEADGTSEDSDQDVGFLVKTSRIQIDSVTQVELAGCDGTAANCNTFIDPTNNQPALLNDRPPLVLRGTVDPLSANPRAIIVIVNHTRSFIDVEALTGEGPRVRAKRKAQGEFLANLVQDLQTNNPTTPVISIGDYNAFQFNDGFTDPVATVKGTPTAHDEVVVDASPDLVNPNFTNLTDGLPADQRYSFIFEGTPQALDHFILNTVANSILQRYAIARNNSDFPNLPASAFSGNASRPERCSDHDMPLAYFRFPCTITCPANVSQSNDTGQCGAVVTYPDPTVSANCLTVVCSPASGSFFPVGTTTVTCTESSPKGGPVNPSGSNGASCTFTVTVNDTQPPALTCPENITTSTAAGQCTAVVNFANPSVSDNCPCNGQESLKKPNGQGTPCAPTCVPASGSNFAIGTTTVTCTATDAAGNSGTCTFTVTVNDTQPAALTCPANITTSTAAGQCFAVVTFADPTVNDNCPCNGQKSLKQPRGETAPCTPTCVPPSGSSFPVGTTTVTCTATDAAGITATCTFTVTVNDTQPPAITCPANITAVTDQNPCPSANCQVVTYLAPVAADNCPGVIVQCTPASGSCFPLGVTTVTCTATDASGNTATCSFTVTTFDVALQDDSNPNTILLWNSVTGAYRFCCNGATFTGVGKATQQGCVFTLEHNPSDRRVLARIDKAVHSGAGSIQAPPGTIRCTIRDRDTLNGTNLGACQ